MIVADTHVHIYPCYDTAAALSSAIDNFRRIEPNAVRVLYLTERRDCDVFGQLSSRGREVSGWSIDVADESVLRGTRLADGKTLFLVAGRQVISHERVEVLALGTSVEVDDGLPAEAVVDIIRQASGVPVLPWSPGKWFFRRGEVVARLLSRENIAIGDIKLRPYGWGTPTLMRQGAERGLKIVHGSDPLPFPGEEGLLGSYGSVFIVNAPITLALLRQLIADPALLPRKVGARDSLLGTLRRLGGNWQAKESILQGNA